jgi:hypothetical protein
MNLENIFEQYSIDLDFAKENKILDSLSFKKIKFKLKDLKKKRLNRGRKKNLIQKIRRKLC